MFGIKEKAISKSTNGWDSGLEIIRNVEVVVPLKLLLVCDNIASKMRGEEFSIVTKIDQKLRNTIYLSEEYYIPKQTVSTARIEYEPDEYNGYNVVIHRHPNGCNSFSGTDNEYINRNFMLSLLYTRQDGFVKGLYNLKISETEVVQLSVEISVDYGSVEVDVSNIKKEEFIIESFGRFSDLDIEKNEERKSLSLSSYDKLMDELAELEQEEQILQSEGDNYFELANIRGRMREIEHALYSGEDILPS